MFIVRFSFFNSYLVFKAFPRSTLINFIKFIPHVGTTVDSKADEEEAEIQAFERHKKFFQEAKNQGIDAWCEKNREKAPIDIQRDINLFIARYSADLEVVITCDGCSENIKGRRYRCLNCVDMDLCSGCYGSAVKPNEHSDQHEVIDLR